MCPSIYLSVYFWFAKWLFYSPLLITSKMRRAADTTEPPPAKTQSAPRVGATDSSGLTGQMGQASVAVREFCSAETHQRRKPDCYRLMEPSHNCRIESENTQQETWTTADILCYPRTNPILPWLSWWRILFRAKVKPFPLFCSSFKTQIRESQSCEYTVRSPS